MDQSPKPTTAHAGRDRIPTAPSLAAQDRDVTAAGRSHRVAMFTTVDLSALNGPSIHFLSIVNGLARLGFVVTAVIPRPAKPTVLPLDANVHVVETFAMSRLGLPGSSASLAMLPALWRARRFDTVYLRSSPGTLPLAIAARLFGLRRVVVETNGWFADELRSMGFASAAVRFANWVQVREAQLADAVRVVTSNISAKFAEHGVPRERLAVIPTGTDTRNFHPMDRSVARRASGLDPSARYLVFIGNLWPIIDLKTVLRAMAMLRERGLDLHLLVVGDGLGRQGMEADARAILGADPPVTFLGSKTPKQANVILNAADVAVAPFARARNESTGLSPLKIRDYAAAGALTVSSAIDGIRDLRDEPWLFLATPEDPASFAAAMEQALALDGVAARARARECAVTQFDWDHVVSQVAVLIRGETKPPDANL